MIALLFTLSSILLITSCQGSELPEDYAADVPATEHSSKIQPFEDTIEPVTSAPSTETETIAAADTSEQTADTAESIDIPVSEEATLTYYGDTPIEERWWYGIVDPDTADVKYIRDNTMEHAEWNSMAIMRSSTGVFIVDDNYDDFSLKFQNTEIHDYLDIKKSCEFLTVSENETYNGLYVERAFFKLMMMDKFNMASVIYNGNITLRGIAKIEKET